jgi:endonuclease YncB( thermonuclease family)
MIMLDHQSKRNIQHMVCCAFFASGSTILSAEPILMTCQGRDKIKQIATLETPRGPATGPLCLDDGDSFSIGPTWVRLKALDAPPLGRYCNRDTSKVHCRIGAIAMDGLAELLSNGIACKAEKYEGRNRWLATYTLPDGRDLGAEIVRMGFACAATKYSKVYVSQESEARSNKRGFWAADSEYDLAAHCALELRSGGTLRERTEAADPVP